MPLLRRHLKQAFVFPAGTSGYAFRSNDRAFVVVEDYREEPRAGKLRVISQGRAKGLRAVDCNDHRSLKVEREGNDWLVALPIRPGDGLLVLIEVQP